MTFKLLSMFFEELGNTLVMTFVSSFLAYVIGIPLGILLVIWARDGISPRPKVQEILGVAINLVRSLPFLILLIAIQSFTRKLVGTTVGVRAIIVPLTLASAPYVARIVESSLKEVDFGIIEAAKSMGASTWQIIYKVLLPEAKPSLLLNAAIAITTILGYSAMAGFVGAGGLGAIAINYGYYRAEDGVMWTAIVFLVAVVQVIQSLGMYLVKKVDKRVR
ncbi:methionine ABC transporter permease [Lachnospiraceae bacterium 45-P1]